MAAINKNERKKLFSGVLAMGAATIIVKILSVLYKIPMLNSLGEEGMGYFNTAYTIYGFFYIVCTAGVPKAIMILLSRARERDYDEEYFGILKSAFILFSIIGFSLFLIFLLISGFIASAIGSPNSVFSMMVIAPSLVVVAITGVLRGYLSAEGRLGSISVSQILEGVFKLCFGLLLSVYSLELGLSVPMCAAIAILGVDIGSLVAMLYMAIIYKKEKRHKKSRQKINNKDFKRYTKAVFSISVPITITSAVMSVSSVIDLFMIMSRLAAIGYSEELCARLYGNYTTLVIPMFNLAVALITPLSIAYLPKLASLFTKNDEARFSQVLSSFSGITMLFSAFLFALLRFFPRQILYFIFGDNGFELGGDMLAVISSSILVYSLLIVVNTALEARGRVRAPLISMLFGTAVKIPVEYILLSTPNVNIFGAVYSTNITYIIALIVSLIMLRREGISVMPRILHSLSYFLSGLSCGFIVSLIYKGFFGEVENRIQTFIMIPIFLIVYSILSIFIIIFKCLVDKKCHIAQKKAVNFR